jgi:hypothetical protein
MPEIRFSKGTVVVIVTISLVLLGYRLWRIKAEPISGHYEAGFYRWKFPKKGKDRCPYRFTSAHALKILSVKGNVIHFRVSTNKPDVEKNPQVLNIFLNGKFTKRVVLKDRTWVEVSIPVKGLKGKKVFMDIQVGGGWIPYKYGKGKSRKKLGVIITKIRQE